MPVPQPQQQKKPKTRVRGKRRWGEGTYAWPLRPLLLIGTVMVTSIAVAAMLLPLATALGKTAQRVTKVGCPGGVVPQIEIQLPKVAQRSLILASDGSVLDKLYLENRKVVKFQNIAPIAKKAVLGIEDYQFYEHGGIDIKSIGRAFFANLRAGHVTQGGSTISQQLVKVITNERSDTINRKLCEAEEAMSLEQRYSKNQILEMYLNEIYLGHGAYGMEAAAETYFDTHAANLNLVQSATLAGMISNPTLYDPVVNPQETVNRRNVVLDSMAEHGLITPDQKDAAEAAPLKLAPSAGTQKQRMQPLFVQFVRKMIEADANGEFDVLGRTQRARDRAMFQGGLTIYTTIDPEWQRSAIHTINSRLPLKTDPQAAIATVEPGTGAVRVLASGRDFAKDPNHTDFVWNAIHQEGSSFKPFTLVAAFREGIPPHQVYPSDSPAEDLKPRCNGWAPVNAEGAGDFGFMDLYTATADSINAVFGRLAADVGPQNIGRAAEDMGIHLDHPVGPADCSITLGTFADSPLDMATAYATLAAGGLYCPYYGVEKIIGPGPKHQVLYQHNPKLTCKQNVQKDIAYQVTDMLRGVIDHGTGTNARLPDNRPEAGKTGTTDDYENAWFCGYVPQVATAVWVGYPGVPRSMIGVEGFEHMFGGDIPALMWHDVMSLYTKNYQPKDFPPPPPPQTGQVPSVIGKSQADALTALQQANFVGVVESPVHSTLPVGVIAQQSPGPGSTEELGFLIHLNPSDGIPPKAPVPNVQGKHSPDAQSIISAAGFTPSVNLVDTSVFSENGIVLSQSPSGGVKALLGSTVTINVGHFVKASPTPTTPPPPPPTTPPPPPPTTPPPTTPPPSPTPKPTKSHGHGHGFRAAQPWYTEHRRTS
ncbi:MAG TPA: transglycosylase domain-containing protein [Actinomycetota bacterium]|nr:transglycosylase domain-containing protein [Actinomycetota bacterium]